MSGEPGDIESTVSGVMAGFPSHEFQNKIDREDDWISYFATLYPEPIHMQSIGNAQVIESLRKNGDKLEKARLVEHWIYFTNEKDQSHFLESIEGLGFAIKKDPNFAKENYPFVIRLSRVDKVDHLSVDSYVLDLWQKAQDANGDYDGWETFIVKD